MVKFVWRRLIGFFFVKFNVGKFKVFKSIKLNIFYIGVDYNIFRY